MYSHRSANTALPTPARPMARAVRVLRLDEQQQKCAELPVLRPADTVAIKSLDHARRELDFTVLQIEVGGSRWGAPLHARCVGKIWFFNCDIVSECEGMRMIWKITGTV